MAGTEPASLRTFMGQNTHRFAGLMGQGQSRRGKAVRGGRCTHVQLGRVARATQPHRTCAK
eukprot:8640369-Alexandrium_andersonii.AAC.1